MYSKQYYIVSNTTVLLFKATCIGLDIDHQ